MSGVVIPPPRSPHFLRDPQTALSGCNSPHYVNMSGRKRKANEELVDFSSDRSSSSPSPSPSNPLRTSSTRTRQFKKPRMNLSGRPVALPRLLETLSPNDLRGVLRTLCDRHPEIGAEIASTAPRPTVASTLSILGTYEATFQEAFPYGDRPTSDYAFNRVREVLMNLLEALKDYTPQFLPPHEAQSTVSLSYLDGATQVIHRLPEWDSFSHNRHKQEAYEEIARAWSLVLREAVKKGAGIQLQYGGWDQKLIRHNELSGGRLAEALSDLKSSLGWNDSATKAYEPSNDVLSIRQQLFSNTYGASNPVGVGTW